MKKILLFLLMIWAMPLFSQTRTMPYDFPIKPGSVQWKKFQSRSEMANVLQIPDTILKDLTTEALVTTCMEFPMFKDLYFFNHIQTGFDGLK